jgi:hypothetical protein
LHWIIFNDVELRREEQDEMKKTAIFVVVVLLTAGAAYAREFEDKKKAGEYDVEVRIDKPSIGINIINIGIKDNSGKYVTDAKVSVEYSMMTRGIDVPRMTDRADAVPEKSGYRANLNFPMAGSGDIVVHISRAGKSSSAKFHFEVH